MIQSLANYSNRSHYAAEITRTTFLLAKILEDLGDASAAETRKGAEYNLLEISIRRGRRLRQDDLDSVVAAWSL